MAAVERIAYARLFSTVAGLLLVGLGLAGFFTSAGFRNPGITADLLGFYPVNGWASTLHLTAGLIGLGLARPLPRLFALLAGILFLALGIAGILAPNGDLLLGVLPATRSVNLLNLAIGALGLIAYVASRWDRIRSGLRHRMERLRRRAERRQGRRRHRRAARRRRSRPARPTSSGGSGGADRPEPGRRSRPRRQ